MATNQSPTHKFTVSYSDNDDGVHLECECTYKFDVELGYFPTIAEILKIVFDNLEEHPQELDLPTRPN